MWNPTAPGAWSPISSWMAPTAPSSHPPPPALSGSAAFPWKLELPTQQLPFPCSPQERQRVQPLLSCLRPLGGPRWSRSPLRCGLMLVLVVGGKPHPHRAAEAASPHPCFPLGAAGGTKQERSFLCCSWEVSFQPQPPQCYCKALQSRLGELGGGRLEGPFLPQHHHQPRHSTYSQGVSSGIQPRSRIAPGHPFPCSFLHPKVLGYLLLGVGPPPAPGCSRCLQFPRENALNFEKPLSNELSRAGG